MGVHIFRTRSTICLLVYTLINEDHSGPGFQKNKNKNLPKVSKVFRKNFLKNIQCSRTRVKKGHSWCTFFVVNVYTIEILVLYVYYFRFRHILSWMDLFQLEIIRLRRKKFIIHCSKVLYLSSHKWCCWNQFTVHTRKWCINFIILCRLSKFWKTSYLAFHIPIKILKFFKPPIFHMIKIFLTLVDDSLLDVI